MAVSQEEVIAAYFLILGRAPENEAVVKSAMNASNLNSLRNSFFQSDEFRHTISKLGTISVLSETLPLDAPPLHIETFLDDAKLKILFSETKKYWEKIGSVSPHWSVITLENYLPSEIKKHENDFFASGEKDKQLIDAILKRIGRKPSDFEIAVEYGCGVGRVTGHLSTLFNKVVGLDISKPHLEIAEKEMKSRHHFNVAFKQVSAEDLMPIQSYNFWFSRIVLQHNPPPVIASILDVAFKKLRLNGIAIFQVPTYKKNYHFDFDSYISYELGTSMEMHFIPQCDVIKIADQNGCRLLEIREDTQSVSQSPDWLSNLFVFEKVREI